MKYLVLLRGVNISGKNKVSMSILKNSLLSEGYLSVKTYLNSGNIILESDLDKDKIVNDIVMILKNEFNVVVPVFIIEFDKLKDILNNTPKWWGTGNKEMYDNLIFIMPGVSTDEVCDALGKPSDDIERVYVYDNVIFWSFKLDSYKKANWWIKTASTDIKDDITIRTANTVKKLLEIGN